MKCGLTHSLSAMRAELRDGVCRGLHQYVSAAVALTAVQEEICERVLLKCADAARIDHKVTILPAHVQAAKANDAELSAILPGLLYEPEVKVVTAAAVAAQKKRRAEELGVSVDDLSITEKRLKHEREAKAKGLTVEALQAKKDKRVAALRAYQEKKKLEKQEPKVVA